MASPTFDRSSGSPKIIVAFAWLFVGLPLCWGVYQTGRKSLSLFTSPPPANVTTTVSH